MPPRTRHPFNPLELECNVCLAEMHVLSTDTCRDRMVRRSFSEYSSSIQHMRCVTQGLRTSRDREYQFVCGMYTNILHHSSPFHNTIKKLFRSSHVTLKQQTD